MSKGHAPRKGRDDKAFAAGYDSIDWGRKDAPEQALQELSDSSQELGAYDMIVFADEEPKPFAYYDPSSGKFALDKDSVDIPRGATVWPLIRM